MNALEDVLARYRNGSAVSDQEANRLLEEDGTGVDLAEWRRLRAKATVWSGDATIDDTGDFEAEQQAVAGLRLVFEEFGIETRAEYHEFRREIDFDHPFKEANRTLVENVTPWSGRSAGAVDFEEEGSILDQLSAGDGEFDPDALFEGEPPLDMDKEDV